MEIMHGTNLYDTNDSEVVTEYKEPFFLFFKSPRALLRTRGGNWYSMRIVSRGSDKLSLSTSSLKPVGVQEAGNILLKQGRTEQFEKYFKVNRM